MRHTFRKNEKLKSRKLIKQLFLKGKSISDYPLRLIYLQSEYPSNKKIQTSFSVSKRKFRKAVDRNRIKRVLRECYRKNKQLIYKDIFENHILMFTYLDENELKYVDIEEKMIHLLMKLAQIARIKKN
jgi:ribonuclease P protein component